MNIRKYPYRLKWVSVDYEFESVGPKGVIKKIVNYCTTDDEMVNLALGDWNEELGKFDFKTRSKNGDTDMVLATVASTLVSMMSLHPLIRIFAKGSTPARNRLYRVGIVNNWPEIEKILDVEGQRFGEWEPFNPNTNYDAFRAKLKPK